MRFSPPAGLRQGWNANCCALPPTGDLWHHRMSHPRAEPTAPSDNPAGEEGIMAQPERFDMLVLGSGEGAKRLAWHLAHAGYRTAVVERQWIGGSCPNINCLPSKNEIWSAKVADLVHRAAAFGTVTTPGPVDMARVRQRKRDMVEGQITRHLDLLKASGAWLIIGAGQFVA